MEKGEKIRVPINEECKGRIVWGKQNEKYITVKMFEKP